MVHDLAHLARSAVEASGLAVFLSLLQPLLVAVAAAAVIPIWLVGVGSGRAFYRYCMGTLRDSVSFITSRASSPATKRPRRRASSPSRRMYCVADVVSPKNGWSRCVR